MSQTPSDNESQRPEGPAPDAFPGVYAQLRRLAERHFSQQRPDHTLQPTALVHEAYLRLARSHRCDGLERVDMLRMAAQVMRSVLVDHARGRNAQKRKGAGHRVALDAIAEMYEESAIDLIALDEALVRLAEFEPQWAAVIELRFFGGCTEEEAAETLEISARTVRRQWRAARAWLRVEIEGGQADGS